MKADSIKLVEFLAENKTLFKIPVYQRNYEWDKHQCSILFQDLEMAIDSQLSHFMGPMVYVSQSGPHMSRIHVIIDGQQRLTSLMLLLKALHDSVNNPEFQSELRNQFLVNQYLSGLNNGIKLEQVDSDQKAFQDVMHGQVDTNIDDTSNVVSNYLYFMRLVNESRHTVDELYDGLALLNMVYIELSTAHDDENPQVIFESLNSKGIALSQSDLIRNFLLMPLSDNEQTNLYHQYWSKIQKMVPSKGFNEFVRNYLVMHQSVLKRNRGLYVSYKMFFYQNKLDSETALRDLYQFAINYDELSQYDTSDAILNDSLMHINGLVKTSFHPYLLLVYSKFISGQYSIDQLRDIFKLVENFAFRKRILASYHITPTSMAAIVKNVNNDGTIELHRLTSVLLQYNFPNDDTLRNALLTQKLYWSSRSAFIVKHVLSVFEAHYSKELVDLDKTQIEHIMPQHLTDAWDNSMDDAAHVNELYGNTIGNLTLTMYNQEMSNKSFDEKCRYYADSNIYITRQISDEYNNWDANTIKNRSNQIADVLIDTFPMPRIV